ncbi:prepilin peptidase [Sphingorhabdus sp. SMR4y]|uniref:A24 family peptidase n=1 Tax=Sphingorhabdus sp. SMR4y TaxID=2584094 RepID=UPI000B5C69CE|nr:prepilin peptidase [Sphingorhabdus sp. SMR4y]ASK88417.1 type IV leader peptidase family protein [Sphingorhabdus sp. SMR4y]
MTSDWLLIVLTMLLVSAAVQDMATMRISNLFPVAVIALFGVWIVVHGFPDNGWENGVHFAIALVVGMGLFALGWFGGGDAKLYASCALWFDLAASPVLLLCISMAGLILLLAMLFTRRFRRKRVRAGPFQETDARKSMQMPYGVAIAAGTIFMIYWVGVNPATFVFDPTAVSVPLN